MKRNLLFFILFLAAAFSANAQSDMQLYQQFNGRYDFTFCGNTLNPSQNNITPTCTIFTQSSATLALEQDDTITAAYLYWAGSGTGDFEIKLNGANVTPDRTFPLTANNIDGLSRQYFSAFKDVTAQVQATGNGVYTVSDLDLTTVVASETYCGNKTNFGGWAIIIVYENAGLPLNQLNLYDGMQYVPAAINITLPSLNVIDNAGAKIGFLAWEGDAALATESLTINGNVLSSLPLNPSFNAFNSTNSVTGSSQLYNMDLDIYDIQDNIQIGDETAEIQLTSTQDFVMVNAVLTKLNSQLPDATIAANDVVLTCDSRVIEVKYTVYNVNSTDVLPAETPVSIYIDGDFIELFKTSTAIPIGGSESGSIFITIPDDVPNQFELMLIVDDAGDGTGGIVTETNETNNIFMQTVTLWISPVLQQPADITGCDIGNGMAYFDFSGHETSLKNSPTDTVRFYTSLIDAENDASFITETDAFLSQPKEIFVRLEDENGCYDIATFMLVVETCNFPDATVSIGNVTRTCNSRNISVQYRVANTLGNAVLPAGTPIAIFADGILITTFVTQTNIPIGGNETGTINVQIPDSLPLNFQLVFDVDNQGNGTGIVDEINEENNLFEVSVTLIISPVLQDPADLTVCDTGNGTGIFDFSVYETSLRSNPTDVVTFYTSLALAQQGTDFITPTSAYTSTGNMQEIFVRLENTDGCYSVGSFLLLREDCFFPDATISIGAAQIACNSRIITVDFTVSNLNSFDILPAGTPISIYLGDAFLEYTETLNFIPIGGSESSSLTLTIPDSAPLNFALTFVIDDIGDGTGIVVELDETNNSATANFTLIVSPEVVQIPDLISCNEGFGNGTFDFSEYAESVKIIPTDIVTFHLSRIDAEQCVNPISNTSSFPSTSNPQQIYVRLDNGICPAMGSFLLRTRICPPETYNYVTPNNDGINDTFFVKGLRNIFLNFKMSIYNRWGSLVWTGDHSKPDWDGIASEEKVGSKDTTVPVGTYYFVLELNEPDYPKPIVGWVYVTK